jgi:hypothetical protein
MKTITITRKNWLHGEGGYTSRLIRRCDEKKCCLGFYLEQCGISPSVLENTSCPSDLGSDLIPQEAQWLLSDRRAYGNDSKEGERLMNSNDSTRTTDGHKEKFIKKTFANHGVKVKFV